MRRLGLNPPLARALAVAVAALVLLALSATGAGAAEIAPWVTECVPPYPTGTERTSETCGATLLDGRAIPPDHAPPQVKAAIAAANRIDGTPYVWGGGHLGWSARGYDCSGAVGYALHGAGLLDATMVSGQMELWGAPGVGRWITIYANSHHVFMTIAGLRFDTRDDPVGVSGPRWHPEMADWENFVARHPPGL